MPISKRVHQKTGTFTQWNTTHTHKKGASSLRGIACMDVESIMLSEVSQAVKDKYYVISPISET